MANVVERDDSDEELEEGRHKARQEEQDKQHDLPLEGVGHALPSAIPCGKETDEQASLVQRLQPRRVTLGSREGGIAAGAHNPIIVEDAARVRAETEMTEETKSSVRK